MPSEGHVNVNLPQSLADRVDRHVAQSEGGFTSRAEVVRVAVRAYLDENE